MSALLTGGLAVLLLNALAGAAFTGYLPLALAQGGGFASPGAIISAVSVVQTIISAIGWVLVLVAAFIARPEFPRERAA